MRAAPTKVSYFIAGLTPISIVSVLATKVGAGNGEIYPIALMSFVPFGIGAGLAWSVRGRPFSSWFVLLGIIIAAVYGFEGVHSAFFRVPARGAIDLIYRPVSQTIFMLVIAAIIAVPTMFNRLKREPHKPTKAR